MVGNFGYDVSFTLPKSYSLLLAFADEPSAAAVEGLYTGGVGRPFDWLERQTAYGMRGHHGDGKTAAVVPRSGFLGWSNGAPGGRAHRRPDDRRPALARARDAGK